MTDFQEKFRVDLFKKVFKSLADSNSRDRELIYEAFCKTYARRAITDEGLQTIISAVKDNASAKKTLFGDALESYRMMRLRTDYMTIKTREYYEALYTNEYFIISVILGIEDEFEKFKKHN